MNLFQKFRDFIVSPSHSRTMALLVMLLLVSAVSLTVIVAQQQQTIKQRASTACPSNGFCTPYYDSYKNLGYNCDSNSSCSYDLPDENMTGDNGQCCVSSSAPAPVSCTGSGEICFGPDTDFSALNCSGRPTCSADFFGDGTVTSGQCCVRSSSTPTPTPAIVTCIDTLTSCTAGGGTRYNECAPVGDTGSSLGYYVYSCDITGTACERSQRIPCPAEAPCSLTSSGPACGGIAGPTYTPTPTPPCVNQPYTYAGALACCPPLVKCSGGLCVPNPSYCTGGTVPGPGPGGTGNVPIPNATSAPVTLRMALNPQGPPFTTAGSSPSLDRLFIYDLGPGGTTLPAGTLVNTLPVSGRIIPLATTAVPNQLAGSVDTTLPYYVPQHRYQAVAKMDNRIGRTSFLSPANPTANNIIEFTTNLVPGDIDNNNKIDISDYNALITCWNRKIAAPLDDPCDFDKNGVINEIDYNTWLRGFAQWNAEGQVL